MKHLSDEQLVFHHYQVSDDGHSVEAHLAGCEACRARYQALQDVLSAIPVTPVPERSADYGRQVWQRLQPRLDECVVPFWRRLFERPSLPSLPRWWLAPAMTALVLAAFLVGLFWSRSRAQDTLASRLRQELRQELVADFQSALNRSQERSSNALAALEARLANDSKAEARQLVQALHDMLGRARAEDRQMLLAMFRNWEEDNAAAYVTLRQDLEELASLTDKEMRRARSILVELAAQTPPPDPPFRINK
ncbi:MAG: hypothetical protein HZA90_17160 [Verrucomicrobia bacterium]|nr:hypothetical protein [Verrucomicrobiota bacterium]